MFQTKTFFHGTKKAVWFSIRLVRRIFVPRNTTYVMEHHFDNLKIIAGPEIGTKVVEWLWYSYIAYGKITIVQGDSDERKFWY